MAKRESKSENAEVKSETAKSSKAKGGKSAAAKATDKSTTKAAQSTPARSKPRTAKTESQSKTSSSRKTETKPAAASKSTPKKTTSKPGTKTAAKKTAATKAKKPAASSAKTTTTGRRSATPKKPWLKSYPAGIPADIGPLKHNSVADLLSEACRDYAARPAFTCMDKTITYGELEKTSRDFAAYLQALGLEKGARVAVMMPNVLQYPVTMMAILRAGYVVVNANPLYTARELEHQLKDSGAEAIVILENFAKTLQVAIGKTDVKHVIVATMGDMLGLKGHVVNLVVRHLKRMVPAWSLPGHVPFNQALREGASAQLSPVDIGPDDLAFLQYTGGTTGVAKGAMLLHRNVLANVVQNEIWLKSSYLDRPEPERSIYICVLPLYHIYAMTVNALTGVKLGAQNILITNPRDIPALVKELGKYPFNVFVGLNTLFKALLNNEEFHKLDFKKLDFTLGGGMAVQRSVAERWKKLTGHTIHEGYGLSETSPVATVNRLDSDEFTGSIGLPLPSTEVAIRDEKGRDVKLGEVGELCIRGPQVMAGYWNQPEETAKAIMQDGFFMTGDIGVMDETGHVKIVDRKKDMILVSGFNVYPNEIEDVVAHHPGVLEAAAVGVPDEHSGEVPKLFIVKKDAALTEQDILDYCHKELTGYKRPKHVEFRSELPKSNVGKILRRELR
uniref:long-chain-fatty-acid--CoA ligase n=1 Tax=Chelativorans sp. YIM 93263 TaxID=2906648 RepID=UPI002379C66D|nr:long-chain-fatty-acid--CoA ligase [Chelativorans sp. YIM 93263]